MHTVLRWLTAFFEDISSPLRVRNATLPLSDADVCIEYTSEDMLGFSRLLTDCSTSIEASLPASAVCIESAVLRVKRH